MANRRSMVSFQQFPIEILSKILQKAEKNSGVDYCNLQKTCRIMNEAGKSPEVLRSLSLLPLVKNPRRAYQHMPFLNRCLDNDNCVANFVQGILSFTPFYSVLLRFTSGILTYFLEFDKKNGMAYLRNAANGEGEEEILEAAYLYGVLRYLHDDRLEGPFDDIAFRVWREEEEDLVARVWRNLRRIMHIIYVTKKPVYMQTMRNRRPPPYCHLLDLEVECANCFMFKRGMKFYYMK